MASPQLEGGHTKIANELVEALGRVNLSAYESRILWCIIRKTYGWSKKTDRISYTQFEEATRMERRHIARTLKLLVARRMIEVTGTAPNLEYSIQKDYEKWIDVRQVDVEKSLPKEAMKSLPNQATETLPKEATENQKDHCLIRAESLPNQAESLPKEAMKSLPNQANTKAIKHYTKAYTKEREKIVLPDWIKEETWDAFMEVREKRKAVQSDRALKNLIADLDRLRLAGNDPEAVLNQSITNSWKGVFALKENRNGGKGSRALPTRYPTPEEVYGER